ncbi:ATP-dependent nuclease [Methylomagnum ishizawai]|uniref:ATP-dependent nuclease n=1 Tax=Methylomagnum ishizawai TaxID=1760988 RepID=UPI001C338C7D|nr:ATP-dependent endonuclease [Methylomagnum ishizawai]BBL73699.1 hypothetical protein MishRS11D_07970 [Methylomagnum ishizawai]
MYLYSYRLKNYRRLRDVYIELAKDISIFVGSNNSGKTSATHAIQAFLSGSKDRFSLFDFSSHVWKLLNAIGENTQENDVDVLLPSITLDLWFKVSESDLGLVLPILPSTAWQTTEVGIRVEFGASNSLELLQRYRKAFEEGKNLAAKITGGAGSYLPWPKNLTDYLEKELQHEFEFRYFVLNRACFNERFEQNASYEPDLITTEPGGGVILKSLMQVDFLSAQRHLADSSGQGGRAENLSRRLSAFYKRNLEQRADDHSTLKALFESEAELNRHLMDVFKETLQSISNLGYPGLNNPKLEIKSALNPVTVMIQDTKVHYILGEGEGAVHLPDNYNGLGFKNLIYMVVEILDLHSKWKFDENRPPLHLIFIEEPEAHLHAQLQQVFIRNVLDLVRVPEEEDGAFLSQFVITTHSAHILYERGFVPIRYFRRHITDGDQTTQVLNLSGFQPGNNPKDRDFLQRYLKLTHCDLFFADAAILVEGNVERLLLPLMIEKEAPSLRSVCLCILEVSGAFGHRFKELIEFLGITTLIITDIDSVSEITKSEMELEDEDEEKEIQIPSPQEGGEPEIKYGKTCLPSQKGAVTANQTLIQWLPKLHKIEELFNATASAKEQQLNGSYVRVTYQLPIAVTWNAETISLCGRTLEEAFGLENAEWCQATNQKLLNLILKTSPATPQALAEGLHKRVTRKKFDKTKFALGVLTRKDGEWVVPLYIREGLMWLKTKVDFEIDQEADAVADATEKCAISAIPQETEIAA